MNMLTTAMLLLRSSLFLSLHLAGSAGSFPKPLSPEEEQRYLARCIQGDLEARNVLVERNMRLVAHIIKKYYTQTVDQDDLISIGTIGLIKGISSYKPEKNVRLATYAARCIENEILMFFRSQKKLQGEVSLSETLETDKDGNNLFLMDVVGVEDTMLDDLDTRENHIRVRQLVDECLTEREADIIRQRYGLGGKPPRTQRELAAEYGISRSYV
jgi:RNA polymerase sporulation-specific sigma factor